VLVGVVPCRRMYQFLHLVEGSLWKGVSVAAVEELLVQKVWWVMMERKRRRPKHR
jgi:hypothetical protein